MNAASNLRSGFSAAQLPARSLVAMARSAHRQRKHQGHSQDTQNAQDDGIAVNHRSTIPGCLYAIKKMKRTDA
jgi:hypothetical protein